MTDQPTANYCGKLEAEIERLRAALEEILRLSDCDSAGDAMVIADRALKDKP